MAHRGSISLAQHDYPLFRQQDKQQLLMEKIKNKLPQVRVDQVPIEINEISIANEPIQIQTRIVFLKIGQIDTRNERYDAEAYIESSWLDDKLFEKLSLVTLNGSNETSATPNSSINKKIQQHPLYAQIQQIKNIVKCLNTFEFNPSKEWTPQLYIDNSIGDIKEEFNYTLEIVQKIPAIQQDTLLDLQTIAENVKNFTIKVCELRRVRGVFYERLELHNFPMDIQELSITVTSKLSKQEVRLIEHPHELSSISVDEFLDQQEWDLFSYVHTSLEFVDDFRRKYERSTLTCTGFISRKPGYYLYNAYMLIFLISTLGFIPFSFSPDGPQFRLQTTAVLILTSVNFRWLVTQRIPPVPYLTSLDKYAIGSLFFLIFFCIWHSLIGCQVITNDKLLKKSIDTYALIIFGLLALAHNLFFFTWFMKKRWKLKILQQSPIKTSQQQDKAEFDPNSSNELSIHNQLKRIFTLNAPVYGSQPLQKRSTYLTRTSKNSLDLGSPFNTHEEAFMMHSLF